MSVALATRFDMYQHDERQIAIDLLGIGDELGPLWLEAVAEVQADERRRVGDAADQRERRQSIVSAIQLVPARLEVAGHCPADLLFVLEVQDPHARLSSNGRARAPAPLDAAPARALSSGIRSENRTGFRFPDPRPRSGALEAMPLQLVVERAARDAETASRLLDAAALELHLP